MILLAAVLTHLHPAQYPPYPLFTAKSEKSSTVRQRAEKAHQLQLDRQEKINSRLNANEIGKFCALDIAKENLLTQEKWSLKFGQSDKW